ncbi:MAG: DegT/DnrJ/EryC1/StrS family aminotransferase [Leucobacter sp.]
MDDFTDIVEANWYSNFGPFEQRFREGIADYLGTAAETVVTVNNATTGLMAALAALLPRGNGSESIAIASFTFAAGAQAIIWHGYRPAWIDIDEETLQPSLTSLRELSATNPGLRAILFTNTFGIGAPDIDAWESEAADLGVPLIVDSAAGFGSRYPDGALLGARGDCEVFSFHATKPFAIGEGGAVVCKDPAVATSARQFTNFGFSSSEGAAGVGLNGKLQELNAAIGLRQLKTFETDLESRRAIFDQYVAAFAALPLRFPPGSRESSLCFASAVLDMPLAPALLDALVEASIDGRSYYSPALHLQPWFAGFLPTLSLRVTERIVPRLVSLPILPGMSAEEVRRVITTVAGALRAE